MKKILAIAILAVAGLLPARSASLVTPKTYFLTTRSSGPPVTVMVVCSVNGVNYPVDFALNIWARLPPNEEWMIIGQLVFTTRGPVAYSRGIYYPASC